MHRRSVLRAAGTVALGLTAGCLADSDPDFQLRVVDRHFGPGPTGNLTVTVTVSNPGNTRQSGMVYVRSEVNERSLVRVRNVTLEPHETVEIGLTYDVDYGNVTSFTVDASVEPAGENTPGE
ncbi:MAG: hypothetical protein ABEJ84_04070 [Halodesulfurarchaeum sp.]